jgi:hypothetical protein
VSIGNTTYHSYQKKLATAQDIWKSDIFSSKFKDGGDRGSTDLDF